MSEDTDKAARLLEELNGLHEKATDQIPGDWTAGAVYTRGHAENNPPHWHIIDMRGKVVMDTLNSEHVVLDHDYELGNIDIGTGDTMKFVAAARNAFPLLAAYMEEAMAARDPKLNSQHNYVGFCPHCAAHGLLVALRARTDAEVEKLP